MRLVSKRNTVAKAKKHIVTFGGDGDLAGKGGKRLRTEHSATEGGEGLPSARGPPSHELDQLLTVQDVAALLRCSVSSLNKWRLTGNGPRFVYIGARVRYRVADVAHFIAASTRSNTSQTAAPPPA